jgi:DNA-directed RNA polymerase specialized sigma24 family protein
VHDVTVMLQRLKRGDPQAAEVLGISVPTAKRDWTYARARLFKEINRSRQS